MKELLALSGQMVVEKAISLIVSGGLSVSIKLAMPNTLQTQLNISTINSGLYMVRYDDGTGKVQSKSLIKN